MKKLKIVLHFVKIRLKNIGSILIKISAGYAVASFGLIQVASIVTDNLSIESMFGISTESFMQILFISVLALFPIVLIISYISKKKNIDNESGTKKLFLCEELHGIHYFAPNPPNRG